MKNNNEKNLKKAIKFIYRIFAYAAGLLFMAFGVAFSVNSQLGVSPVNSLPYVVSLITSIDIGTCVTAVFAIYIIVQLALLRKEFKPINFTQLLFSMTFGYFVDFAKQVVGDFTIATYVGQLAMLAASIVFVTVGVSLYMDARIVNMPMEGMTLAISQKVFPKLKFHTVKVIIDCTLVAAGILLSFAFLGELTGIREGTIICALTIGVMMKPIQRWIHPIIDRICF